MAQNGTDYSDRRENHAEPDALESIYAISMQSELSG